MAAISREKAYSSVRLWQLHWKIALRATLFKYPDNANSAKKGPNKETLLREDIQTPSNEITEERIKVAQKFNKILTRECGTGARSILPMGILLYRYG